MPLAELLDTIARERDINSLLEVGANTQSDAENYCAEHNIPYWYSPSLENESICARRYDLAILHFGEPTIDANPALNAGIIKNQLSSRILVLAPEQNDPFNKHYLALGFVKEKSSNISKILIYSYNIATYNRKRAWNSPEFWANPENWNKRF